MFLNATDGKSRVMPILVVDDRDGRVVAELESHEEALHLLTTLDRDAPHLCIVEFHDREGAILGTETSVTLRPL
jgi:hypothetical protein